MKKLTRILLTLALAGALLCGGALAAGDGSLTVQLDGKALTFTDALPQMKDGRTFLPFRALFEAMGAEVSYDSQTSVVTAVRGDRTITMALGSNELTITEGGKSQTVLMDVAPYVDTGTWRTYVPVRFAAQALNCAVGWEQSSYTVLIVDTEKLVTSALAGKRFGYLDKLKAFAGKFDRGIWDVNADLTTGMSLLTMPVFTMEGTLRGTMQDAEKMAMDMTMKVDLSGMSAMSALTGEIMNGAEQALMEAMGAEGMTLSMRLDRSAGAAYINMKGIALEDLDPDAWYKLDGAAMTEADLPMTAVMDMDQSLDLVGMLADQLSAMELTDASSDYTSLKTRVEGLAAALADESFKKGENGAYTAAWSMTTEEGKTDYYLSLTLEGGTVTGCQVSVITGDTASSTSMTVTMSADGQIKLETVQLSGGGLITSTTVMEGRYTQGTTPPETTPPTGAAVLELEDLDALAGMSPLSLGK